ncbi:MAG: IS110 family transposase [Planctomycetota bacterium]
MLVGCDLHDKSMLLQIAHNREKAVTRSFGTDRAGRSRAIVELKRRAEEAGGAEIVFAYEACAQGFGLHDDLTEDGIRCFVLAPTRISRSTKARKNKTDEKDGDRILELLRGHVLAGNKLPSVWVPDAGTRDDREVVRTRVDLGERSGRLRTQIGSLLRRCDVGKPAGVGKKWTKGHRRWLKGLLRAGSVLGAGARQALGSLLRQLAFYEEEVKRSDGDVEVLSEDVRYRSSVRALCELKGVQVLTAMVFLTEMGDLSRFENRRQIGSYLGLVPSSAESGEDSDRKGHITHQGSRRARRILCQASWARVRSDAKEKGWYEQVVLRNPKHKKIAIVGSMRRLGIVMWHRALAAQQKEAAAGGG